MTHAHLAEESENLNLDVEDLESLDDVLDVIDFESNV